VSNCGVLNMTIVRYLVIALLAAANLVIVANVEARGTGVSRQQIKSMPILERPSRVGHFYGNTVRRRAVREGSSSAGYVSPNSPTPATQSGTIITPMSLLGRTGEY
jgi:hypothetical protein